MSGLCVGTDARAGPEETGPAARLLPCRPNPFATATTIPYVLSPDHTTSFVVLTVHDASGRLVKTLTRGRAGPGAHSATWKGRDTAGRPAPSGVYYLRLVSPDGTAVRRVVRLR